MGWTQPLCDECWKIREPGREPARFMDDDEQICCACGATTVSGIYARIDPASVSFPSADL